MALAIVVAVAVLLMDTGTKRFIERELGPGGTRNSIQVVGNFVELRAGSNGGVAFGLLSGSSTIAGILAGIVIVPLTVVLVLMAMRGPVWAIGAGLVIGGAAGNLFDRIDDQAVIDFISIGRWPSFNLADAAITIGAIVLIATSLLSHDSREKAATPK